MEGRTDEQTYIVKPICAPYIARLMKEVYIVKPICAPYIARLMKEVSLMNNSVKKLLKSDHK